MLLVRAIQVVPSSLIEQDRLWEAARLSVQKWPAGYGVFMREEPQLILFVPIGTVNHLCPPDKPTPSRPLEIDIHKDIVPDLDRSKLPP